MNRPTLRSLVMDPRENFQKDLFAFLNSCFKDAKVEAPMGVVHDDVPTQACGAGRASPTPSADQSQSSHAQEVLDKLIPRIGQVIESKLERLILEHLVRFENEVKRTFKGLDIRISRVETAVQNSRSHILSHIDLPHHKSNNLSIAVSEKANSAKGQIHADVDSAVTTSRDAKPIGQTNMATLGEGINSSLPAIDRNLKNRSEDMTKVLTENSERR